MLAVGIRELKARLSAYLRRVHAGDSILVTDRGRVVAEIRQPGASAVPSAYPELEARVRRGKARLGAANSPDAYPALEPLLEDGESRRLLDQERDER
jgi:antitoxin (DNA-binding transcriptional repressor) of toxin-antitoxin stability system